MPERYTWSIDIRWKEIANSLPDNVFLISLRIFCARSEENDKPWGDWDGTFRSFKVMVPSDEPYIPYQTIYFYNPLEKKRLPGKEKTPRGSSYQHEDMCVAEDFFRDFQDFIRIMEMHFPGVVKRIYIDQLRLCEIPEEYIREGDSLEERIDRKLYTAGVRVTIGDFGRPTRIATVDARKDVREIIAWEKVLKPCDLTEIMSVVPKPVRKAYWKKHYYTATEASKHGKPDYAPKTISGAKLELMEKDEMRTYFPNLVDMNILKRVKYTGDVVRKEEFLEKGGEIIRW